MSVRVYEFVILTIFTSSLVSSQFSENYIGHAGCSSVDICYRIRRLKAALILKANKYERHILEKLSSMEETILMRLHQGKKLRILNFSYIDIL